MTAANTAGKRATGTARKGRPARRGAGATRTAAVVKAAPSVPAAQPVLPTAARAPTVPVTAPAAAKQAGTAKADKTDKAKKPKLVRDSFTIPKAEYAVIDLLKARAARLGRPAKKSEVLRAGVKALEAMTDAAFVACIGGVPSIKTGRPAKG